jgi:Rad3-related DNA helicase
MAASRAPRKRKPVPAGPRVDIDILSSVPQGWTIRPNQAAILKQVEDNWDKSDVFVIDAPVAAGKSLVAVTIALWAWKKYSAKGVIIVPNNILLSQYKDTFSKYVATVGKQTGYTCKEYENQPRPMNCKASKSFHGSFCQGCPYLMDLRKMQGRPVALLNYHSYIAYKAYRPLVIIDEAHNTIPMIGGLAATKLWHHDYHYPSWVRDYRTMHKWATDELPKLQGVDIGRHGKLTKLIAELESNRTTRVYSKGSAMYRNEDRDAILSSPVDISAEPPILWPPRVDKIVLLSATFNSRDVKELGLDSKRVCYVNSPSAIPKENRPCHVQPKFNLSYWNQDKALPHLVTAIEEFLLANPDTKGFIHAPYSLATKLRHSLGSNPRLLFHDARDKIAVYNTFKETPATVMVGSGMYEGISLDEDLARWQIICKVPWPSLAEPAMQYLANNDTEYYANRTIKDIVQTYGRVCRGPTDTGDTYIWDSTFGKLTSKYKHLMPAWFVEALDLTSPVGEVGSNAAGSTGNG